MTKFSKNSKCDSDIDSTNPKRKHVRGIVIGNIAVMFYHASAANST